MVVSTGLTEQIKILDFGLSTFARNQLNDPLRITSTRDFLGTPLYAAPEQLRGEPVSVKSDIYAWGLLFLECITGSSPFSGSTIAAVVQQQLSASPVPLPATLINHRLGTLLRWTLEKNADRRAGNASIIASNLETVSLEGIGQSGGFLTSEITDKPTDSKIQVYEMVTIAQERRQVTIVCCTLNLIVSPEVEMPEVIDEIYNDLLLSATDLLKKFNAHVVGESGDRLLAFFGYPEASDTDARRAARSALELAMTFSRRNAVFTLRHAFKFTYRISVTTGMVTVRKTSTGEPHLSGLTINRASALCNSAEANSIYVSGSSFPLINHLVECTEISPNEENSREINYKMTGERRMKGLEVYDTDVLSPLAGRDGEMARLLDKWRMTGREKTGRVILLQGEAGIGKSRLAAEFARKVTSENCGWMECQCLPEGKNSALHPILDYFRSHFGISGTASPDDNVAALEHHLKSFGVDCSVGMPIFCSWLGFPVSGYAMPQFSPQRQKEFMLQTSSDIIARIAKESDSVIMIEDLHWADQITLELLPKLFEQVKKRGVLLLMSARPEFTPTWKATDAETVTINPLEDDAVEIIIRNIFGPDKVGSDTIAKIVRRVDGVPLFAEEVTRLISEKGADKEEIPVTLRDLLTGKIDQLGPARETAQIASVIGREFDYKLIESISLKDAASLLADLDQLISAGVMHVQLVVSNPHYMFHHVLLRDSVYASIPSDLKKTLHKKVAQTLENDYQTCVVSQPELLAYHWTIAEDFDKATDYGVKAAQLALSRTLNDDAIEFARHVIDICQNKFSAKERELLSHNILSQAMMLKMGWGNPKVTAILDKANQLMESVDNLDMKIQTTYNQIMHDSIAGFRLKTRNASELLVKLSEQSGNSNCLHAAMVLYGHNCWIDGDYVTSVKALETVVEANKIRSNLPKDYIFGFHTAVWAMATYADVLWFMNEDDATIKKLIDESISLARSVQHIPSLGIALWHKAIIFQYWEDRETVRNVAREVLDLSANYGMKQYECYMQIFLGWADLNLEIPSQAIQMGEMLGTRNAMTYYNSILADIEMDLGNYDRALEINAKSIALCDEMKEYYFISELYRKRAGYLMAKGRDDISEEISSTLQKSIQKAEELKIKRCENLSRSFLSHL